MADVKQKRTDTLDILRPTQQKRTKSKNVESAI